MNAVNWTQIAEGLARIYIEAEKRKEKKWRAYWKYHLFTPFHIRLWHKITFKKVPKI